MCSNLNTKKMGPILRFENTTVKLAPSSYVSA